MRWPMPNEEDVESFRDLYFKRFCIRLSDEDAYELARKVVGLAYIQRHNLFPVHHKVRWISPPGGSRRTGILEIGAKLTLPIIYQDVYEDELFRGVKKAGRLQGVS